MPIDIKVLARQIVPEQTVLILGSGASVPSGGPTGFELRDLIGQEFKIPSYEHYSLADLATIAEAKTDRSQLVSLIRKRVQKLQPTGGLLNAPLFPWGSIFTTNYDDLVEKAYKRRSQPIRVISSNHDFHGAGIKDEQELFKFHGTIDKDVIDGSVSRIIITSTDYDQVYDFREALYARLRDQLFSKSVLIIGQSLADPDLRSLVDEALKIKTKSGAPGRIYVFVFRREDELATVFEARGLSVTFGGVDELFSELTRAAPAEQLILSVTSDVLGVAPQLEPATVVVATELSNQTGQIERMFNGRAASYGDIARRWVFDRDLSGRLETQLASTENRPIALVLGAAGVGKTSAVRIALSRLSQRGIECWEHKPDFALDADSWVSVNKELIKRKSYGVLFVDSAHNFLREINQVIEKLGVEGETNLKILLTSSRSHWNPRLKSAELFRKCEEYDLSRLSDGELNGLLDLLDSSREIQKLVEDTFLGFSRPQRMERLKERCNSDMFVCMKNIFAFQAIDAIILQEFGSLEIGLQEVYRLVAGMQAIGAKVHRELVRRLTGLPANRISALLDDLDGILEEYTVSERFGIYGWKVRHQVIADILARYKYSEQSELYSLFDMIIGAINPAYGFEAQSLSDMCDLEAGIPRLSDRSQQNILLRKIISMAPDTRVARHRLIFNLIDLGRHDIADSEIRIFERELNIDRPVMRYKVRLKLSAARNTLGMTTEDKAALAREAVNMALILVQRFPDDKNMYRVHLDAAVDLFRYTGQSDEFENAMRLASGAQEDLLDPELRSIISQYLRVGEEMGVSIY